jgi:hypothetical protein
MIKSLIVSFLVSLLFLRANAQEKSLFNGKDLTGWHIDVPAMDKDPKLRIPFISETGCWSVWANPKVI